MTTIFAPITAPGLAGVTVIRISGSKASACLNALGIKKKLTPRRTTLCRLFDLKNQQLIDQALVTFFPAPASFTGEDIAEIALHASPFIYKKVFQLLSQMPEVRPALPGEFSKIAFLNGKMDLVEAEGMADLITAQTQAQHRQAIGQMQGALSALYEQWRHQLLKLLANIEAFIDFPDEDLPEDIVADIEEKAGNLATQIKAHLADGRRGEKIRQGLNLAIIGAANAGKSSLINYLAKSEVAIVSPIAGTTRDVVEVHLEIAGTEVIIADTAGIRASEDIIEKEGIRRALSRAQNADLKILVLAANELENFDQAILDLIDKNTLFLINKIDLVRQEDIFNKLNNLIFTRCAGNKYKTFSPIALSLKDKINLEELLNSLEEKVRELAGIACDAPLITRERYRICLREALANLENFSLQKNIELAAEDLRLAMRALGQITGKVAVDDILDVIFSGFCIGK